MSFKDLGKSSCDERGYCVPPSIPHEVSELHTVFCDGTGQRLDQAFPTNIALLYDALADQDQQGIQQTKSYYSGIGTRDWFKPANDNGYLTCAFNMARQGANAFTKLFNFITGHSIERVQKEIYKDIVMQHHKGREYAFVGFSRGSYMARSLCGMMYNCGILDINQFTKNGVIDLDALDGMIEIAFDFYRARNKPSSELAEKFRKRYNAEQPHIRAIVDLDSVGALGIPRNFGRLSKCLNSRYEYHDPRLNRFVRYALQAIAADEKRLNYNSVPLYKHDLTVGRMEKSLNAETKIEKIAFPGTHDCVGGGDERHQGLSNAAAIEVIEHLIANTGMQFDEHAVQAIAAKANPLENPDDPFEQNETWLERRKSGGYRNRLLPADAVPSKSALARLQNVHQYAAQHATHWWTKYDETRPFIENRNPAGLDRALG